MNQFTIGLIKVNGMAQSAAVGVGTRLLIGANSNAKSNTGGVAVTGDWGVALSLTGWIDDRDVVDGPVHLAVPLWSSRKEG